MNRQLLQLPQVTLKSWLHTEHRSFASSCRRSILVGPPDPVSNIRPVIYDDIHGVPQQSSRPRRARRRDANNPVNTSSNPGLAGRSSHTDASSSDKDGKQYVRSSPTHPYLLDEFSGDPSSYQWRVEQSRLDAYNHAFWKDSNSRFEEAKRAVLASVPESASPEAREVALSEFYAKWYAQERGRLQDYSKEWNRRNFGGIFLAARGAMKNFRSRLFGGSR